jgi:hypothetical protein
VLGLALSFGRGPSLVGRDRRRRGLGWTSLRLRSRPLAGEVLRWAGEALRWAGEGLRWAREALR